MKQIYTKSNKNRNTITSVYWNKSWKEWTCTFTEKEFKAFLTNHGIKYKSEDLGRKQGLKLKILHMKHARERKTVCGIKYDNTVMHKFIPEQLAGYWRRVTCKKCLKKRK